MKRAFSNVNIKFARAVIVKSKGDIYSGGMPEDMVI